MSVKQSLISNLLFAAITLGLAVPVFCEGLPASTPVGSWQIREQLITDHKNRQTVSVIKTSLIGEENRDGRTHVWVEMDSQNYKIKKDKRKKSGQRVILKSLVDISNFGDDPTNVLSTLSARGKEVIFQSGKGDPMLIEEGGMFAGQLLQALGATIDYNMSQSGSKTVTVPAGEFTCQVTKGSGTFKMKVVLKTMKVESQIESCSSNKIPFGIVHSSSQDTTNGKPSQTTVQLTEFGMSGAMSQITKTPTVMPKMPKLF